MTTQLQMTIEELDSITEESLKGSSIEDAMKIFGNSLADCETLDPIEHFELGKAHIRARMAIKKHIDARWSKCNGRR